MDKPSDIEQWAWDEAMNAVSDLRMAGLSDLDILLDGRAKIIIARALDTAYARGVEEERNGCLAACEREKQGAIDNRLPAQVLGINWAIEAIRNRGSA